MHTGDVSSESDGSGLSLSHYLVYGYLNTIMKDLTQYYFFNTIPLIQYYSMGRFEAE